MPTERHINITQNVGLPLIHIILSFSRSSTLQAPYMDFGFQPAASTLNRLASVFSRCLFFGRPTAIIISSGEQNKCAVFKLFLHLVSSGRSGLLAGPTSCVHYRHNPVTIWNLSALNPAPKKTLSMIWHTPAARAIMGIPLKAAITQ